MRFEDKEATVAYDPSQVSTEKLLATVKEAGFEATIKKEEAKIE